MCHLCTAEAVLSLCLQAGGKMVTYIVTKPLGRSTTVQESNLWILVQTGKNPHHSVGFAVHHRPQWTTLRADKNYHNLRRETFRTSEDFSPTDNWLAQIRTKIVAMIRDLRAQNVPKMLLRPELGPTPHWKSSERSPDPLSGFGSGREGRGARRDGKRGKWV